MDGIVSFGNKRTYDEFKKQIPNEIIELFDLLRNYCLSLGDNVVEDVRMHRIVFGKSMTFRWFADLEPQNGQIIVKIQRERKEATKTVSINSFEGINGIKKELQNAYQTIR